MSDFLSNLTARAQQPRETAVQPRTPARFEPVGDSPTLSLELDHSIVETAGEQRLPMAERTLRPLSQVQQPESASVSTPRPVLPAGEPATIAGEQPAEPARRSAAAAGSVRPVAATSDERLVPQAEPPAERIGPVVMLPVERHPPRQSTVAVWEPSSPPDESTRAGPDPLPAVAPARLSPAGEQAAQSPALADRLVAGAANEAQPPRLQPAPPSEKRQPRAAVRPRAVSATAPSDPPRENERRVLDAPAIRVSIGRIEVRAQFPASPDQRRTAKPATSQRTPALPLDQYLRQRNEDAR